MVTALFVVRFEQLYRQLHTSSYDYQLCSDLMKRYARCAYFLMVLHALILQQVVSARIRLHILTTKFRE